MVTRGDVGWSPDPFTTDSGNPRAWLVLADESLPYPDQESMAVAFTTQSQSRKFRSPRRCMDQRESGDGEFRPSVDCGHAHKRTSRRRRSGDCFRWVHQPGCNSDCVRSRRRGAREL